MTRAAISETASFTALVTGAFFVRNALVIGALASLMIFSFFSG